MAESKLMIITNNEELLRRPCENVKPEEVGELRDLLERELDNAARLGSPGIGLALPQIGIYKKLAIVRINQELQVDLINARIEKSYDLVMFKEEGCLSFPGRVENTMRYQEIAVSDNLIAPHNFIATGLFAVCIQHELDHLNSILLPDRAITKPTFKVAPNDPCLCGKINPITNKSFKFKKCCGKNV